MNPGTIWWNQIGSSLKYLSLITEHLRDRHSAILQVLSPFPWREDFYAAVNMKRAAFDGERRLKRLPWEEGSDPGRFVLTELCPQDVQAEYWPGQTYAEYLASKDNLIICDYYVWVTGVRNKADLIKWAEFIIQYRHCAGVREQQAVFIVEYHGTPVDIHGLDQIPYTIGRNDCRVFCLELASALSNADYLEYQAELALCIAGEQPELCSAMLQAGGRLLREPVKTTEEIIANYRSADGRAFSFMTEQQISSSVWRAAIVILFPIMEQYRLEIVSKNKEELARHLPISNSYGEMVTDPLELEIGSVYYIACSSGNRRFTPEDMDGIRLCRNGRNLLAHNKPIPYGDVCKIMLLQPDKRLVRK